MSFEQPGKRDSGSQSLGINLPAQPEIFLSLAPVLVFEFQSCQIKPGPGVLGILLYDLVDQWSGVFQVTGANHAFDKDKLCNAILWPLLNQSGANFLSVAKVSGTQKMLAENYV